MNTRYIALFGVAAVVVVGGYLLRKTSQPAPSMTPITLTSSPTASASVSTSPTAEVKTFNVTGKSFSFDPKQITVNKGDRVRIVFKNTEGLHDWVLDEFNARTKRIQAGQTDTIEFVADKTGTFEYYCSVGTHRQMGMEGYFTVQ